jgi:predicted nucleic acid-binding protein
MNGIKYLLDTNIIIGLYQHNPTILGLLQSKHVKINECAYSSITRMELLSYPAITQNEVKVIESLLMRMTYLAITPDIENETIQFRITNKSKLPDAILAVTANHHQLELLTLDKQLANKK